MFFRLFYEISLVKWFSISSDIGFHKVVYSNIEAESNLFSDDLDQSYISGFDFETSARLNGYSAKGKAAPLYKYIGLMILLSFVRDMFQSKRSKKQS